MRGTWRLALALLALLAPVIATGSAVEAQQPARPWRIGEVGPGPKDCAYPPSDAARGTPWEGAPLHPYAVALRLGLGEAGWSEGRHYKVERFCIQRPEQIPAMANEVAAARLDLIVVWTPQPAVALKQAAPDVPMVFVAVTDPVATGLVESLAKPGGRITGFTHQADELIPKRIELIRELMPAARRAGLLLDGSDRINDLYVRQTEAAATRFGLAVQTRKVLNATDIEAAFAALRADPPDFLMINPSPLLFVERARIARLARAQRLATSCQVVDHTEAGCLMSYGADIFDLSRRAAGYVERILRGADPGRLPVQQPTRFQLVINLDTAQALGLTIPPALLARADRLID